MYINSLAKAQSCCADDIEKMTVWIGDESHDGSYVWWDAISDLWYIADISMHYLQWADNVALVTSESESEIKKLNHVALARDRDDGCWLVDVKQLELVTDVEILWRSDE